MENPNVEDAKEIIHALNNLFYSDPYNVYYSSVTKQNIDQFYKDLLSASQNGNLTDTELKELLLSLNVQYTNSNPDFPIKFPNLERHMSGNTGEYYVCAELGRRGILGLLAPKNNPLYDIVATNQDGTHTSHIQVKTCQQHVHSWSLNSDMAQPKGNNNLFVILVKLYDTGISYFIWKYDDLAMKLQTKFGTNPSGTLTMTEKDFTHQELSQTINQWNVLGF